MLCRRSVEPGIGSASHRPSEERGVGGSRAINGVDWGRNRRVDATTCRFTYSRAYVHTVLPESSEVSAQVLN